MHCSPSRLPRGDVQYMYCNCPTRSPSARSSLISNNLRLSASSHLFLLLNFYPRVMSSWVRPTTPPRRLYRERWGAKSKTQCSETSGSEIAPCQCFTDAQDAPADLLELHEIWSKDIQMFIERKISHYRGHDSKDHLETEEPKPCCGLVRRETLYPCYCVPCKSSCRS